LENPTQTAEDNRGVISALIGDGRPLLVFTGLALILAGAFALFLSASQHFLPHDVQFLRMTAEQLCGIQSCRIVYFMFRELSRVSRLWIFGYVARCRDYLSVSSLHLGPCSFVAIP
jgi:hypothetical protein